MTSLSHLHHLAWDLKGGKGEPGSVYVCVCVGGGGPGGWKGGAVSAQTPKAKQVSSPPSTHSLTRWQQPHFSKGSAEVNSPQNESDPDLDSGTATAAGRCYFCPLGNAGFPEYQ